MSTLKGCQDILGLICLIPAAGLVLDTLPHPARAENPQVAYGGMLSVGQLSRRAR